MKKYKIKNLLKSRISFGFFINYVGLMMAVVSLLKFTIKKSSKLYSLLQ
jgi:hypothetical protein